MCPPVFYYHSVAPVPLDPWVLKWLRMELQLFENQMAYLRSKNYRSIFLEEWLAFRRGIRRSGGKEICLTFDDGLLDNWVFVYPIAKKYGMRITLFVCPEYVDSRDIVRPNLENVWSGDCREEDLQFLGYLSWKELRLMQESGYVDIQSHTMSHAKYTASDQLECFYYGGWRGLHPILNKAPHLKAVYPKDPDFEKALDNGTPLFEEKSAVVVRKHTICEAYFEEVAESRNSFDLNEDSQREAYEKQALKIYKSYKNRDLLIDTVESESHFHQRLQYEIRESKRILEEELQKPVRFLCWPHGDNSVEAHKLAIECGYQATTSGKLTEEAHKPDRIPRTGAAFTNASWISKQRFHYKIASHYKKQPYYALSLLNQLRHQLKAHF